MLGLYVHIPFCSAICNYCNFNRGLFDADLKARYVEALLSEIHNQSAISNQQSEISRAADTIFFGGGTPSLLEPEEKKQIVVETAKMKSGKMKFFYGCTANTPKQVIDNVRFAQSQTVQSNE